MAGNVDLDLNNWLGALISLTLEACEGAAFCLSLNLYIIFIIIFQIQPYIAWQKHWFWTILHRPGSCLKARICVKAERKSWGLASTWGCSPSSCVHTLHLCFTFINGFHSWPTWSSSDEDGLLGVSFSQMLLLYPLLIEDSRCVWQVSFPINLDASHTLRQVFVCHDDVWWGWYE